MPVKTITAEINGKVKRITMDVPDGATDDDIAEALSGYQEAPEQSSPAPTPQQPPATQQKPTAPQQRGFFGKLYDSTIGGMLETGKEIVTGPGGGIGFLDRTAQAIGKRYKEQPGTNPIARAAGAVFGAPIESMAEDIKQGNIGGALGTGVGNALMLAGPKMVKSGGASVAPKVGQLRQAAATALEESAAKQYGQVLNPTTKGLKTIASEQTVPELIKRRVTAGSLKGLRDKASNQVEALGAQIGDFWDKLPDEATTPADSIIGRITKEALDTHAVIGPEGKPVFLGPQAKAGFKNSEQLAKTLEQLVEVDANGNRVLPVKKLREARQYWDDIAALGKRYEGKELADASKIQAHGKAADAIREQFAKDFPDLDALNKEYSFWKNTERVAEETILRRTGQAKPLTQQLAAVGGAAAGASGGLLTGAIGAKAAATLATLSRSTAWRTLSATTKDRLAKAIAVGDKGQSAFYVEKLAQEAQAAQLAGNASDK